mgnify:CR=1 FL=1
MAEYGWRITKDFLDDELRERTMGPRDISPGVMALLREELGQPFRLYDDDGNLYFEGRMLLDPPNKGCRVQMPSESEWAHAPLYDFGAPDSGCTEIHWLVNGEWVQV